MEIYLLVFIILTLFSAAYFKLATMHWIFNIPNKRSSHRYNTISGGGIIFTFAIILFYGIDVGLTLGHRFL